MNLSFKTPISCKILDKYLYQDNTLTTFSKCKILGVSTYINQTLTFHALINDEALYSDLPISAFFNDSNNINKYTLNDLSNIICKTLEIDLFIFNVFENKKVSLFFKDKQIWETGTYILSIDFYTGNELVHLIELENGLFGLFPNHKINFNNITHLPKYKKNKNIWNI